MSSAPKPADQYDYSPPRTSRNTTSPQHPGEPYWYTVDPPKDCRCQECLIKDAQYRVTFERLDTIFTIENLRTIFLVTFFVEFFWNVFSRPPSSATFQDIIADASTASTSTFRLIITYPLTWGLWSFTAVFRQTILLFKDCLGVITALLRIALRLFAAYILLFVWPVSAFRQTILLFKDYLGVILALLRIALRLFAAYVLSFVWLVLFAVFWKSPLKKLQQFWGTDTGARTQTDARPDPGFEFDHQDLREAVIQELLRQRMAQARAEEEERRSRKDAGGKRSRRQYRHGRV